MIKPAAGPIRIGVGGWTFAPWRGGNFYPADLPHRRELEYASGKFTSIEINGTYYGSQKPASFAKWHDETPDDFVFSLKGPRYATNRKILAEAGPSIDRFINGGLSALQDKLGPINWQFMPTKKFDPADFEKFLQLLPPGLNGRRLRHAVEIRHPSFNDPAFIDLARHHKVAIVVAGDAEFPIIDQPTADFTYARIMGTTQAAGGYDNAAIERWAGQAKHWAGGRRDVFLYVISGEKAYNPAAAMGLMQAVK